ADVDYRSILFAPRPCDLTELSGVVPTPSGVMAASCRTVSVDGHAVREFVLAVPRGVKVKADLPKDSTLRIVAYAE
ncbi:MAG: hypothetical protein IKC73_01265, partial [Clostridia bacterium]|nr:hypothetical protein [Clostridia bacterium]